MKTPFVGKHNRNLELSRARREIMLSHPAKIDYLFALTAFLLYIFVAIGFLPTLIYCVVLILIALWFLGGRILLTKKPQTGGKYWVYIFSWIVVAVLLITVAVHLYFPDSGLRVVFLPLIALINVLLAWVYLFANYPEYLYTLHFSFTLFAAMVIY